VQIKNVNKHPCLYTTSVSDGTVRAPWSPRGAGIYINRIKRGPALLTGELTSYHSEQQTAELIPIRVCFIIQSGTQRVVRSILQKRYAVPVLESVFYYPKTQAHE